jgi:hypothetical protein
VQAPQPYLEVRRDKPREGETVGRVDEVVGDGVYFHLEQVAFAELDEPAEWWCRAEGPGPDGEPVAVSMRITGEVWVEVSGG